MVRNICLFLFALMSHSNLLSQNIDELVKRFDDDWYMSEYIGHGHVPTQWLRFDSLTQIASDGELIQLTKHTKPSVKWYSFEALVKRKNPEVFRVLVENIRDNDSLKMMSGCVITDTKVNSLMLGILGQYRLKLSPNLADFLLLDSKISRFRDYSIGMKYLVNVSDSILLFDNSTTRDELSRLLRRLNPESHYYNRIRALKDKISKRDYVVIISKFRHEEDLQLIENQLMSSNVHDRNSGLHAIKYFPHESLFEMLQKLKMKYAEYTAENLNYNLLWFYEAIVQYESRASLNLIHDLLGILNEVDLRAHSKHIWIALQKYPNEKLEEIRTHLQLSAEEINELQKLSFNKNNW